MAASTGVSATGAITPTLSCALGEIDPQSPPVLHEIGSLRGAGSRLSLLSDSSRPQVRAKETDDGGRQRADRDAGTETGGEQQW